MVLWALLLAAAPLAKPDAPIQCEQCASWIATSPVHVFGNTWWVGVEGLSVVAIDTGDGVILLDGALPQSVPLIKASLAAAGLKLTDVKWIGNSHTHYDHAGGIAALQRDSGAKVIASARSMEALRAGCPTSDDPQAATGCEAGGFPPVTGPTQLVRDGEAIKLGNVELQAHLTPGHTPGSTTWSWKSCEHGRCLNVVYADSLMPVFTGDFHFGPIARSFKASIAKVSALPCDVLLSPHPDACATIERLSHRADGGSVDPAQAGACSAYAAQAMKRLDERLASEAR